MNTWRPSPHIDMSALLYRRLLGCSGWQDEAKSTKHQCIKQLSLEAETSQTRKPCCRRVTARCRCKFSSIWRVQAANVGENRHLGFDRTGNSVIRSADPDNPNPITKHEVDRCGDMAIRNSTNHEGCIWDPHLEGKGGGNWYNGSSIVPFERATVVSYRLSIVTTELSLFGRTILPSNVLVCDAQFISSAKY